MLTDTRVRHIFSQYQTHSQLIASLSSKYQTYQQITKLLATSEFLQVCLDRFISLWFADNFTIPIDLLENLKKASSFCDFIPYACRELECIYVHIYT